MSDNNLDTSVQNISQDELAKAIAQATEVPSAIAKRLAKMYMQYTDGDNTDETVRDVLDNLEVGADIKVLGNDEGAGDQG